MGCSLGVPEGPNSRFPKPSDRSVTDPGWAICFGLCMFTMCCLSCAGFFMGDSRRLTHGYNWEGRRCGIDSGVEDKPFMYLCGEQGQRQNGFPKRINPQSTACVKQCPQDDEESIPCLLKEFHNITELGHAAAQIQSYGEIIFQSTLNIDITQTVSMQQSYPSERFHDSFCIPQHSEYSFLRQEVVYGDLLHTTRVAGYVRGLKHAWIIILISAVLAALLGLGYLITLKYYAGPLILVSLMLGVIILFAVGISIFAGLFISNSLFSDYHHFSLLFRYFDGVVANFWSGIVGLAIIAASVRLAHYVYNSFDQIDESIGVIQAACDCIFAPGVGERSLLFLPVVQGIVQVFVFLLLTFGFVFIASCGFLDDKDISFNDEQVAGLLRAYKPYRGWNYLLGLYAIGSLWLIEVVSAVSQFTVSYVVCRWYFAPNQASGQEPDGGWYTKNLVKGKFMQRMPGIMVYGVDGAHGQRQGVIEQGPGGKVLVIPLAKRGPGGKDLSHQPELNFVKKATGAGECLLGLRQALRFHLGSLTLGAILLPMTRPMRWLKELALSISGGHNDNVFLGNPGDIDDGDAKSTLEMVQSGFGLLAWILDQVVGKLNKSIYVQIVLTSEDFRTAYQDVFDFITQAGGVVTFLYGVTNLYEMVGILCISTICGLFVHVLLIAVPIWCDHSSNLYVEDTWMVTYIATLAAALQAQGFMTLYNVAADTLLYAFSWSRLQYRTELKSFCPPALAYLMHAHAEEEKLWCDACGSTRVTVMKKHNDTIYRKYCEDCPNVSEMTPADFDVPPPQATRDPMASATMMQGSYYQEPTTSFAAMPSMRSMRSALPGRERALVGGGGLPEARNARRGWLHNMNEMGSQMFVRAHHTQGLGMKSMMSRTATAMGGETNPLLSDH